MSFLPHAIADIAADHFLTQVANFPDPARNPGSRMSQVFVGRQRGPAKFGGLGQCTADANNVEGLAANQLSRRSRSIYDGVAETISASRAKIGLFEVSFKTMKNA
jgi:hypothetical protein